MTTALDAEVQALFRTCRGDKLHALLAACGLKFDEVMHWPIPFERPGYERPTTRPLTDDERAMMVELDGRLLSQRPCPVPQPSVDERWAAITDRYAEQSPATRAAVLLRLRRDLVRYGLRRLRAGNDWHWQRPLATVRAETAATLRRLDHARLARAVEGDVLVARPARQAVQMELGL